MTIKGYLRLLFALTLGLIFFATSVNDSFAVDFAEKSSKAIKGLSILPEVTFSAYLAEEEVINVVLQFNKKRVVLRVDVVQNSNSVRIQSASMEEGTTAVLAAEDSEVLREFLSIMLNENLGENKLAKIFLRSINLLYSWPMGEPIAFSTDIVSGLPTLEGRELYSQFTLGSACEWPPTIGLSDNLCPQMNQVHQGDYIRVGVPLGPVLPPPLAKLRIYYPVYCSNFYETVGPYPFDNGDCFGRCGKGCVGDGPPNKGLNIFTQDCFNHDGCTGFLGLVDPYCNQMFLTTVDDFLVGPDCNP